MGVLWSLSTQKAIVVNNLYEDIRLISVLVHSASPLAGQGLESKYSVVNSFFFGSLSIYLTQSTMPWK